MTPELLALAYELRVAGCRWKYIAIGLGVDWSELYAAVRHARRYGLHDSRIHVSDDQLEAALQMRQHSRLSWSAIGRYLGLERRSIECAVYRRKTRPEPGHSQSGRIRSDQVRPECLAPPGRPPSR